MKRMSSYTEVELGNFTNNEIKELVEYELAFTPDDETLKDIIKDIQEGKYINPFKKDKYIGLKIGLTVFGSYIVVMNLGVGQFVPTIPVLSDVTPMIGYVKNPIGDDDFRLLSHRDFNRFNPLQCKNKIGDYCVGHNL